MEFDYYQNRTHDTAIYSKDKALQYLSLGLASEAGEVAGKIAKFYRGDKPLDPAAILDELGDVLWFVAQLSFYLNAPMGVVAMNNLEKLSARKARGTLKGDGDNR